MTPFDFEPRTRIVFGSGAIRRLGEYVRQLHARRVLVVSDQGVVAAGHFGSACRSLEREGLEIHAFHDFGENPHSEQVAAGARFAAEVKPELIVGLGGGSSMDCAKGINFVYSCGGRIQDYWGVGKATCDLLPMIAVPTTAGTGSETQSFALISDAETHAKMACGDPRAACRMALLDPELTLTQPKSITALAGVDALSHALESYVTRRRNPVSLMFSRQAFRLLIKYLPAVLAAEPTDPHVATEELIEARAGMQLGASWAGSAIEHSMLGGAHATANPLTAHFGVTHGQAVGLMLPHVVRLNGTVHPDWYAELLAEVDPRAALDVPRAADRLADHLVALLRQAGLRTHLTQLGVAAPDLPSLAADAARQWTGTFNPVPLDQHHLLKLYQAAL
jgi:alcohol dehydrogenase